MFDSPSKNQVKNMTDAELVKFFQDSPEIKSVRYGEDATLIRFHNATIRLVKGEGWIYQTWPAHGILSEYGFYDIPAMQWREN